MLLLRRDRDRPGPYERGRACRHHENGDRQKQGRMHGVDERVGEDRMGDRRDLGREVEVCAGLTGPDLEAGVRGVAEPFDECGTVLFRQPARGRDRLVVQRQGEPVLQERADDGARQHSPQAPGSC